MLKYVQIISVPLFLILIPIETIILVVISLICSIIETIIDGRDTILDNKTWKKILRVAPIGFICHRLYAFESKGFYE